MWNIFGDGPLEWSEDADAAAVVEADRDPFEELARPREGADVLGSEQVRHQMASVDSMRAPQAGP